MYVITISIIIIIVVVASFIYYLSFLKKVPTDNNPQSIPGNSPQPISDNNPPKLETTPAPIPAPTPVPAPAPVPAPVSSNEGNISSSSNILFIISLVIILVIVILYFARVQIKKRSKITCLGLSKMNKTKRMEIEQIRKSNNNNQRTIVIIGAGPVGLFEAVLLKNLLPNNQIYVFEKRQEYLRAHTLKIVPSSFENLSEIPIDQKVIDMTKSWLGRTRTKDLEENLNEYSKKIGINIISNTEIKTIEDIYKQGIQPDIIIAADGAKSEWRKQIIKTQEFTVNKTIGNLLQIKCEAKGNIKSIKKVELFAKNLRAKKYFFNILIGKYDNKTNTTPVVCLCLIDKHVSREFKDIPSFQGITLEVMKEKGYYDKEMQQLTSDIQNILKSVCKDGYINEKISALPIIYYVSSSVIGRIKTNKKSIPCFLIGDAAMGLSLEKGLNYGWLLSVHLAQYLSYSDLNETENSFKTCFEKISKKAVKELNEDYFKYKYQGKIASSIREYFGDMFRPFVPVAEKVIWI